MSFNTICVFCGCSDRISDPYLGAAKEMGGTIAENGLTLIYGGGRTGLMGALADGALEQGGSVIGVIPEKFNTQILAHQNLTEMHIVKTMHERKAQMIAMSGAFVALPGGYGTFEELFEVLTWAQIGIHNRPIGILNINAYFNPLLSVIEQARSEGFIYNEHEGLLLHSSNPHELLKSMNQYNPPENLDRWVNREGEK
jgi:uncharacterized protein (TIGR00730 family)